MREYYSMLPLSRPKKVFLTEKTKILFQKYFFLPSELAYSKNKGDIRLLAMSPFSVLGHDIYQVNLQF